MSTKLIQTKDYLLLIDEEAEIKKGDYILEKELIINIFPDYLTDLDECDKIIAYYPLTKEAKELDLPLLPNPFRKEVDVEKLALKATRNLCYSGPTADRSAEIFIWMSGYKAAQSKQFSFTQQELEELLLSTIRYPRYFGDDIPQEKVKKIIQSLSTQQSPVSFEPEWQWKCPLTGILLDVPDPSIGVCKEKVIKKRYNEILKQELVGAYKY